MNKIGKKYIITGATGYIGSMLIKYITKHNENAQITALVRNREKALKIFPQGITLLEANLTDCGFAERIYAKMGGVVPDYMIHCASVTQSAEMISHPVETAESIVNATQNVMELARCCKAGSVVYLSSMEVYGNIDCNDGHRATEEKASSGAVELLGVRSCYPLGKRMAENICYSYYKEYHVPVKIARLAQTFGRGVSLEDNRVFAQFARAVKENKDIVLHTKGESVGNYCGIDDAVKGILTILEHGQAGEAYNVVNETNTMTIRQMAEFVAKEIADGKIGVAYDIPEQDKYGYAADTALRLSGKKLMALGWQPEKSLKDMYMEMLADLP